MTRRTAGFCYAKPGLAERRPSRGPHRLRLTHPHASPADAPRRTVGCRTAMLRKPVIEPQPIRLRLSHRPVPEPSHATRRGATPGFPTSERRPPPAAASHRRNASLRFASQLQPSLRSHGPLPIRLRLPYTRSGYVPLRTAHRHSARICTPRAAAPSGRGSCTTPGDPSRPIASLRQLPTGGALLRAPPPGAPGYPSMHGLVCHRLATPTRVPRRRNRAAAPPGCGYHHASRPRVHRIVRNATESYRPAAQTLERAATIPAAASHVPSRPAPELPVAPPSYALPSAHRATALSGRGSFSARGRGRSPRADATG